jgi:arginase
MSRCSCVLRFAFRRFGEPGGFTTREVLGILQSLPVAPVGADLVELNPVRDPTGITAALAVKLKKELLAAMLEGEGMTP